MIALEGKTVCGGIVIGKAKLYRRKESIITRYHIDSSEDEIERFEKARLSAIKELDSLYERAVSDIGENNAKIFSIHREMLNDPDYIESVKDMITDQLINAETAVGYTCDSFVQMFESINNSYMRGRDADIKDVSERVIRILEGKDGFAFKIDEPVVLIADDLTPSETVQFDKSKILAFVTQKGTSNSHTAILARMMNIPAIICAEGIVDDSFDGKDIIVNATDGKIFIEPDSYTFTIMKQMQEKYSAKAQSLSLLKGKESVTLDGKSIELYANIGNAFDVGDVLSNDAEGIGLFRSEFIYLESYDFPTEETQFNIYREVLSKMTDKRVVIRTLDLGADKQASYIHIPHEKNPAMGMRAIRFCLDRVDIFKTQLRALYRASIYGNLSIMFPMITAEWEIIEILGLVNDVKTELANDGIAYADNVQLGCMIETPAAAIISDDLARHLDFFSIGTNDLTQYTLAADRQNPYISEYCDPHHKALLRLIYTVVTNAHKNGLRVGICGELGSDLDLTETFLALDIDELSVSPGMILSIRDKVRNTDVAKTREKILKDILD